MDNFDFSEDNIQHLIIRYLDGQATDEELLCLQEWLAQSEGNFALFTQFRKYWLSAGSQCYKIEDAWQKIQLHIDGPVVKHRPNRWLSIVSYAAAIVLLFSLGYYSFRYNYSDKHSLVVGEEAIEPGSNRAVLVLGSDQKVELNNNTADSLLQGSTILKKEGNTLVYHENQEIYPEEYNRLITPRGGEYSVILADGTHVWLNAESELKYPVHFNGKERKVFLKGEAYFSVTRQNGVPFIVCSDETRITVLGTEFNVRNYQNEAIATTLVKGSVVVAHGNGGEYQLVPGQQAVIMKDEIKVREVETIHYTAWKDGYFVYQNKTLDDILKELSRWYDFTYFYQNPSLQNLTLTAKLRKFDSVDDIFDILMGTGRLGFVTKGKTVIVVAK